MVKRFINDNNRKLFKNKRANKVYNGSVKYASKSFDQSVIDCLGITYFNVMSCQFKKAFTMMKIMLKRF